MLAFRKAAGLTQNELAEAVGETQENISFWERTDKPPRSDVLPDLAKALGVTVDDILGVTKTKKTSPVAKQPQKPAGQVQRAFEEVKKLPRRQQQKILDVVFAMLDQQDRKAS
jgi:transcriptional regulator with XRE-family HTH domain